MSKIRTTKPINSPFRQQKLKAQQPLLTPSSFLPLVFLLGIIFLIFGIVLASLSSSIYNVSSEYSTECDSKTEECNIKIKIEKEMKKPVYIHYELSKFYQNHRKYVVSRNNDQLRGLEEPSFSGMADCKPYRAKPDSDNKEDGYPDNVYYPCGLIAYNTFNDTFKIKDPKGKDLKLEENVAWESDKDERFLKPKKIKGIIVQKDVTDDHFIVWMRTAAFSTFRKLYAVINQTLEIGTYEILINNSFPVSLFGAEEGKKSILLSTTSFLGGKNTFLYGTCFFMSGIFLLSGGLLLFKHLITEPYKIQVQWKSILKELKVQEIALDDPSKDPENSDVEVEESSDEESLSD